MAFSLSPAVNTTEYDLTGSVTNLPSSITGMVLRANKGEALTPIKVTNETELVDNVGYPTAQNYQDWFQAWNFLQYASSLIIIRPIDSQAATTNAGIGITGSGAGNVVQLVKANLYNFDIAENTLGASTYLPTEKLTIFNRHVTSDQRLAIAVSSSNATFTQPIAVPYQATLTDTVSGNNLASVAVTGNTLVVGNKVILKNKKIVTVSSTSASAVSFTESVSGSDFTGITTLVGVNLFEQLFDDSVIVRTKTQVVSSGVSGNFQVQSLVPFNRLIEYEPIWSKGEFVLITLRKSDTSNLYSVVDKATVNYNSGSKDSQNRNYFVDDYVLNNSKYLYIKSGPASAEVVETAGNVLTTIDGIGTSFIYPITNGVYDPNGYTQGDIETAQELFADSENIDVNILIAHQLDINGMSTIAETRKDCTAIVAPYDYDYLVTNGNTAATKWLTQRFGSQTAYNDKQFNAFGTYSAVYGNVKYQYDKFNKVNRWICVAGDIAGLYAATDSTLAPWWAVAGDSRGVIKNAIKLAFNPNKQNRDDLYVNAINPIMPIAGEGSAVVYGQKTATGNTSAFDRVNVRRLFIYLEKAIATAARKGLFEFNDNFTRARIVGMIEPFLKTVRSGRGITDFRIKCDSSNNTPEVINSKGLVIDIYIQPEVAAEGIQLNAIAVNQGVNFDEIVGAF